jgi:hypothetical protein
MDKQLKNIDNNISGNLQISENKKMIVAYGNLATTKVKEVKNFIQDYLNENYPNKFIHFNVTFNNFTVMEHGEVKGDVLQEDCEIDEVKILWTGVVPISSLSHQNKYKLVNPKNKERINNSIRVMNFIAPIILNKNFEIIDGELRLQLAEENNIKEVPVIVLDTTYLQENTLRLALNRSSEFQRWNWVDVDNFVDDNPQIQPILEPLGLFGRYVLPESFFTDTVIQYKIDPFNKKQMSYNQEWGLAKWAEIRRKQIEENLEKKKAQKKPKSKPKISLFDLSPKEEDFLPTYDAEEELKKFNDKWKDIATEISAKKDEWSKARKEELGQEWQLKNRNSRTVALDKRTVFENQLKDSHMFSNEEIDFILEPKNLLKYRDMNIEEIRDDLNLTEEE